MAKAGGGPQSGVGAAGVGREDAVQLVRRLLPQRPHAGVVDEHHAIGLEERVMATEKAELLLNEETDGC